VCRILCLLVVLSGLPLVACTTGPPAGRDGAVASASGPATSAAEPAAPSSPATVRAVFLGDSCTAGLGSDGRGYVAATAAQLGWEAVAAGQSGTGYVDPGTAPGQAVYGERVAAVAAQDPDVVVVQGSTNDAGAGDAVGPAASAVYAELQQLLPEAEIVVLGPLAPPAVEPAQLVAVRNALAAAASQAGLPFIDPITADWLQPVAGLYTSDGLHPNDAGYDRIAAELASELRDLGY
jgi:acyl-CoA thioesterase-1